MKVLCIGKTKKHLSYSEKTTFFFFILLVIVIISVDSCTERENFTLGQDFVESQTNMKILDTFKIDLSTVLYDSLATSGTGVVYVGEYKDADFGTIKSKSYFELGFPTYDVIEDLAVFDSAAFILGYSGYNYGDTTALMSISIHQLTERITLNKSGYLYNNSTVKFSPGVLGTKLFYPEPNSADTVVSVPVNEFGRKLFGLFKDKDESVSTSDYFLDYLKGFAITSDAGENSTIIGFLADENHIILKIYYHIDKDVPETKVIAIKFGNSNVQFNNIQYDLTNTLLKNLKATNNIISSSQTGNKAFLQGLIGLMPKIQFPTLKDLLMENHWKILRAELILEPVKTSYDIIKLPKELYLYDTDKHNKINNSLNDASGAQIVASLYLDELFKEDTRYTFDITSFIISEFSDSYFDYEHGILVGLKGSEIVSTFGRMIIEGKRPAVKLRLYYLTY